MLSDAEYELEREVGSLRAELIRERRARELRAEVSQLAASTSAESDRSGVARVIAHGASAIFDAGWAMVAYAIDNEMVRIVHGPGVPDAIAADWTEIPLDTPVPICEVLRGERREIALGDPSQFTPWPLLAAEAERAEMASLVVRRISWARGTPAVVAVGWPRPHVMDAPERELLDLLARTTAPAFDRSGRTEVDGEMARTLQEWLLESRVSAIPGVDVETLYQPGSNLLAVGGDWYDVIDLGGGRAAVVVGDVVGHDVKAAVAMSQVRHVLAAHLLAGHDVASVLDMTDTYLQRRTNRSMATAVVVVFEGDGEIVVGSAGHPPPVVAGGGMVAAELATTPGPPLGSGLGAHTATRTTLPPGSTLVAYTDGVVEERGEVVDTGIDELVGVLAEIVEAADAAGTAVAPAVAQGLRARLALTKPHDDTALVVMHMCADEPG